MVDDTQNDAVVTINRWNLHPFYFCNGAIDFRVIKSLEREMSYFVENAQRTNAYKQGRWDGTETLLHKTKKGIYYFPCGMIDTAKRVFNDFGVEYIIQDIKLEHIRDKYKPLNLKWTCPFELYDYQKRSVSEIKENESGTICLPTGAGKTLIMIKLIHEFNLPVLVVVHNQELLYQWERAIKEYLGGYVPGLVGDNNLTFAPITIAMVQTLNVMVGKGDLKRLDFPVLLVDEVHRIAAETCYTVAMQVNAAARIGASATPTRTDGKIKKLWAATGEIKSRITAGELIERGLLAKPKFVFLNPPATNLGGGRMKWNDVYVNGIVLNEPRNDLIVKYAKRYASENLTVYIHTERIDHGEMLSERIPGSVFLHGKDNSTRRQMILKRFEEGKIKVLVSTLLKEGVSINTMNVFIAGGGMKSPISVIQKMGRALRIAPGKTEAIIVDFRDQGRYLGSHWEDRFNIYVENFGEYVPK